MVEILKDLRFVEQLRHPLVRIGNLQSYDFRPRGRSCSGWAPESKKPSRGLVRFRQQLDLICDIADGTAGQAQSVEEAALVLSGWARNNPGNLGGE